ncbi:hypothetical protein Tco_0337416 [Tanacetum coccineum]
MPLIKANQSIIPFPSLLKDDSYDEKEVLEKIIKLQVKSTESGTNLKRLLMEKSGIEDEIKGACVSVMRYSTFAIRLEKLAPTKLIIELAERTIKRPKGLVENVLVDPGFGDFLKLNDLNVPLELRNNAMEDLESDDEDGEIVDEP